MRKTEATLAILFIVSATFKLLHIAGFVAVTTIVAMIFAIYYLFFGFAILNNISIRKIFSSTSYKDIGWKKILLAAVSGIALCYEIIGILFGLMRWNDANIMIWMAIMFSIPLIIFNLIYLILRKCQPFKGILIRLFLLLIICIVFLLA